MILLLTNALVGRTRILFLVILCLVGCSDTEQTTRTRDPIRVLVEPVQYSNQQTIAEAVGTSRALQSITLHPIAAGEVVSVNFEPGERLDKGHVLVQLDQRKELLAVELAQFRLAEAESLYARYKKSAETGATLPTTLETARTELEAARIGLGQARIALQDRTIVTPFAGHAGITDVDAGDRVQPATAITTLDNRSALLISFELPEVLLNRVNRGDPVSLQTWDQTAAVFKGEIIDIGSRVDPELRTFVTRAKVDNSNDRLRPGMSFRVRLQLEGNSHPLLPETAVQWGADGAYIWTVVDSHAQRIPVNIIQRRSGKVIVDGNIEPSSLVIVEGIQRLRPGVEVQANTAIAQDALIRNKLQVENG